MFDYVAGLPAFLAYFGIGVAAYVVFVGIYITITPHREIELIRGGNVAAVVAFLGALLGFSLPLASAASHSIGYIDFAVWALVGLVLQILAYFVANFTMQRLHEKISNGEMAAGLWGAGVALLVGILNAACMTY